VLGCSRPPISAVEEWAIMKTLSAKVLDPKHLELAEPLPSTTGEWIRIVIPDADDETSDWRRAAMDHFLDAYGDQDAIYDEL